MSQDFSSQNIFHGLSAYKIEHFLDSNFVRENWQIQTSIHFGKVFFYKEKYYFSETLVSSAINLCFYCEDSPIIYLGL